MNVSYIILHGIGDQNWLQALGVHTVASYLRLEADSVVLYDYSRALDSSKFHPVLTRFRFVGGVLSDILGFFKDSSTKNAIVSGYQKLVAREQAKGKKVVVIAHSLGTVVAALGAMDVPVIALGAPLHWPFVRKIADTKTIGNLLFVAGTRDYVACFARNIPGAKVTKLRGYGHSIERYWFWLRDHWLGS